MLQTQKFLIVFLIILISQPTLTSFPFKKSYLIKSQILSINANIDNEKDINAYKKIANYRKCDNKVKLVDAIVPFSRQKRKKLVISLLTLSIVLQPLQAQAIVETSPSFVFGNNVRAALEAYQENPEAVTCNLDNQNIKVCEI